MKRLALVLLAVAAYVALALPNFGAGQSGAAWTESFPAEEGQLTSTGRNPYFVLEPGHRMVLEDGTTQLTITVLAETKTVAGVETRIVEERETVRGVPIEVSRNYFAISRRTNSVYYFGEDVDMYTNGKVTGHEGGWLAGVNGARYGLMMPGLPLLQARYYQEIAPKVAMDRAQVTSVGGALRTPAGNFTNVLRIEETTPLEPGTREAKFYAAGVGLIQDGSLKLVKHGPAGNP